MRPDPERLAELMTPQWSEAREEAILRRLQTERVPRSRVVPWALAAAAAVVVAFVVGRAWQGNTQLRAAEAQVVAAPAPPTDTPTSVPAVTPLNFRDGTSVVPDDASSEVVIASASDREVRLQLRRGGARFDVTPNAERRFAVEAGLVTVEVLGTEFGCQRLADRTRVDVVRGRVAVSWAGGSVTLDAGESGLFPPEASTSGPTPTEVDAPTKREPRWRRLARGGDREAAYDALRREGRVANRAEALMLAADVARKAGHPEAALPYLERVLKHHRNNSRAPLAAFTMGRIELQRRRYRVAAQHFATVGALGSTSLAEHALAREVEAWIGAKDRAKARRRAKEYLRRFPKGPRAEQVRAALPGAE